MNDSYLDNMLSLESFKTVERVENFERAMISFVNYPKGFAGL